MVGLHSAVELAKQHKDDCINAFLWTGDISNKQPHRISPRDMKKLIEEGYDASSGFDPIMINMWQQRKEEEVLAPYSE